MLVVGAPLAVLAENEWGTGIRVHRRHFRTRAAFNSEGSGRLICWMKASLSRKTTVAN